MDSIPAEFRHLIDEDSISWERILDRARRKESEEQDWFEAFTDVVVDEASKECMKETPDPSLIALGLQACLTRGRMAEALFLSTDSQNVAVLSLRAIALFVLSDISGLTNVLSQLEKQIDDNSLPAARVRLSVVRLLLAAAERDTSVIVCAMEFDSLLEDHPEQVEQPLTETMFAIYVMGTLLRETGQVNRASRIADTLEDMAKKQNHRMFLALVENLKGNIANLQGDFDDAEKHYTRVREYSDTLSFRLGHGMALNNLGTLRLNSLRLEDARVYFTEALEYMDMEVARLVTLSNLGEIETLLGNYTEADDHLRDAVRLEQKTRRGIIEAYTWSAILKAKQDMMEEASRFLEKAQEIADTSEKPLQKGMYLHARAVVEAAKQNQDAAVSLLGKVLKIAKEEAIFELLIRTKLELVRTHMSAFQRAGKEEAVSQATYHIGDLIQIAKEQNLQALYAEALLLRSDILVLAGKDLEVRSDLDKVVSVARFIEDKRLEEEAKLRFEMLEQPIAKSKEIEIGRKMDRVAGFKPAGKMKDVPRPALHAILALHTDSGLPEYVHYFRGSPLEMDSSIVGGFISAVSVFTRELMGDKGLLRSINHEGFTLLMEHTPSRVIVLIADKESFDVRFLLHDFAERFDQRFPPLSDVDGIDTAEYTEADQLVEEIFQKPAVQESKS